MNETNERVIALSHTKDKKCYIFGEGEYIGKEIPAKESAGLGKLLHDAKIPNPTILLDSGEKIYGCECWWGDIDKFKKKYSDYEFIKISIKEQRNKESETNGQ